MEWKVQSVSQKSARLSVRHTRAAHVSNSNADSLAAEICDPAQKHQNVSRGGHEKKENSWKKNFFFFFFGNVFVKFCLRVSE